MLQKLFLVLINVYKFLQLYIYGFYALIRQILQKHRKEDQLLHTGFVAIVTGGAEGIGFEVSRTLVSKNVHVVIGSRCTKEGKAALSKIKEEFPNAKVDWIHLDLMSFKSVRDFVDSFLAMGLSLNILINNAGVMLVPYSETEEGLEEHFQVNYLGHFYLTTLLLDVLKQSAGENFCSRIINVTSIVHYIGSADIDTTFKSVAELSSLICFPFKCKSDSWEYSSHAAYCNSKLAIMLWTTMLSRHLNEEDSKVTVNAVHPGIVSSNLYRHVHWCLKWLMDFLAATCYKTPEMGADSIVYLALSPTVEGHTGGYYDNCTEFEPHKLSRDKIAQEQLWTRSHDLIKIFTDDGSNS